MADDPSQPPSLGFKRTPRDREPGSIFNAVVFGATTDIVGTYAVFVPLIIVYQLILSAQGLSDVEIKSALEHVDPWSAFGIIRSLCGLMMSVLGGFVCARTANVNSYTAVGIVSAISVAFGTMLGAGDYSWSSQLMLNLLSLVAIFAGGWWYIRKLATPS